MAETGPKPSLDASVLIATRDRADELVVTLRAMALLETEGLTWELIVVDNGSKDSTEDVLRAHLTELPLRVCAQLTPGKNHALSAGISMARGALLIFTDDDVTPSRGWVRELCSAARRWPADGIFGGPILPEFPSGTPDWIASPDFSYASIAYARYVPAQAEGPVQQAPFGGNIALRAGVLERFSFNPNIGPSGGDYAQGSEYELTRRMNDSGLRNIFIPDAEVVHRIRRDQVTAEWLSARAFRFGRGSERIHPTRARYELRGVPLELWWQIARGKLRTFAARNKSERDHLEVALESAYLDGRAVEYRDRGKTNKK